MKKNKVFELDKKVSFWFSKQYHHKKLNSLMIVISNLGDFGLIWLVCITLATLYPKGHISAQRMLFALLLATILGQLLIKSIVKRLRPCQQFPEVPILIQRPNDSSFPSGHTTSSFAVAVVVCFYNLAVGLFALFFACIMGISRLYLFVHYLSDILMATVLGISIGLLIMMF